MTERQKPNHLRPTNLSRFLFGAPYYPEHWGEEEWRDDPDRMAQAHFNVVRIGEFAWDRMEPQEGQYDFSFFDEHIKRLAAAGIKTILCTPTATPPRWLTHRHPEVLRVDANGRRMEHGSRQHACHSSEVFRSYSRRITQAMAQHYQDNPNVIGWQTDNEFFCHFSECYCDSCRDAFQKWLENKYGDIAELNKCWGTAFWSLTFDSFDQVSLPYPQRPTYSNPAHLLDYHRFLSDAVIEFQKEQVELLRQANDQWFITHNGFFRNIDYRKFVQDLDFFGVDIYPMFHREQERPAATAFKLDATRSFGGNFIIPELQSGPGGQGDYLHSPPLPGQMRLFAYQAIARGCDGILHFRWRTCRFGAEEYWVGILDHDNQPRRRYREAIQEGEEFERIGSDVLGTVVRPNVGVLYDTGDPEMAHQALSHGLSSPSTNAKSIHGAWYKAGYNVGLIHPEDDISTCAIVILPSWPIVTAALAERLTSYVEQGGTLVITGRSGIKDENNNVLAVTPPGFLAELCGVKVEEGFRINEPELYPNHFTLAGEVVHQSEWLDRLEVTDATVVSVWTEGYHVGVPAVTSRQAGRGRCFYVSTFLDEAGMQALIPYLSETAGVSPLLKSLPEGVEVSVREGENYQIWFILNHRNVPAMVSDIPAGTDLLSGAEISSSVDLGGYGVAVVKVKKSQR